MATKTLTKHICDRCEKVFDETDPVKDTKDKGANAPPRPILMLELIPAAAEGQPVKPEAYETVKFDDLCAKCHGRVEALVRQIHLYQEDKEKEKPTPKPADKPVDSSPKPADNKGGKPPDAKADAKA